MTPHVLPSRTAPRWSTRQLAGAALLVAAGLFALVGPLVGGDPLRQDLSRVLEAPGGTFLLGTDHLGRNMVARLAHAARLSLGLAMLTVVSAAIPGTLLGIAAAWRGGWLERVLAGIADGVLALPALLLVALLTAVAPGTLWPYYLGLSLAFFNSHPGLAPEWRLMVITGFLGALTTFSSFSAEVVGMIQLQRYALAAGTAALHLAGSLALTVLGLKTAMFFIAK